MKAKIIIDIKNGKATNHPQVINWIHDKYRKVKTGKYQLVFSAEYKPRSSRMNDYYWPGIVRPISKYWGPTEKQVHEGFKRKYIGVDIIGGIEIVRSSKKLSDSEFIDYWQKIRKEMYEEHEYYLPLPNEVHLKPGPV